MIAALLVGGLLMQDAGLKEADAVFAKRDWGAALESYRKVAESASGSDRVEALAQVARCLSLLGKLDEGRPWLEKAAKLADAAQPGGWSRTLGVRGIFERESGDKAAARKTFEELYAYCRDRNLPRRAVDAVHHLALVVPPEEQPAWALKGIAEAEKLGDEAWLAVLWNNLGATYEDLKLHPKALEAYLKARDYHHKTGGEFQKHVADWAVGHAYRLLGKTAEARPLLEAAHAWGATQDGEWKGWTKKDLGLVLAALGDRERGVAMVKEARQALLDAGMDKHWPESIVTLDQELETIK